VGTPPELRQKEDFDFMVAADNTVETLLNEHDIARITGLSVASVRRWRLLRQGPKYLKIGAAVRYTQGSIKEFLATRPTGGGYEGAAR
jgi:predicted DNA-binding transcriptional regulator AlpA